MTEKEYRSVDYVCQKLRESIIRFLQQKAGEFPNSYHYYPREDRGIIYYKIQGLETTLTITSGGLKENYNMLEVIDQNGREICREESSIRPGRTGTHRISEAYLAKFIMERIENIKKALSKQ
ncbi:hypothetical protein J4221_00310 [Candidatus Pacearchaeota archaeon]|nr:hypothetical protein [Candidatus Pacearchaeota archaeon]